MVSVVVPAFNAAKYIERSVKSALCQTVSDIEVLVVDDASNDATVAKVQHISDPRVRVLENTSHSGPSTSRNHAISEARGEWIAVLDADDWWEPTRLAMLLNSGANYDADVVCDDLYLADDDGLVWNTYFKSRESVNGSVREPKIISPTTMIQDDYGVLKPVLRADFLRHYSILYKENHRYGEDFAFLLDCLLAGAKMILVPVPYYYYRLGHDSLSSSVENSIGQCTLLTELISSAPYTQLPDVRKYLEIRLRKKELILQELKVQRLLADRQFVRGLKVIARHPQLLMGYARAFKSSILSTKKCTFNAQNRPTKLTQVPHENESGP